MKVRIQRLPGAHDLPLPSRASSGSSGFDLRAAVATEIQLAPGQRLVVPTGLVLEIPPGFEAQVRPRSGLALKHGVTVANAPGTIDSDYRGEVGVILVHLGGEGSEPFAIRRGDRIAQLVVAPVAAVEWEEAGEGELEETGRGAGGYGSTGLR